MTIEYLVILIQSVIIVIGLFYFFQPKAGKKNPPEKREQRDPLTGDLNRVSISEAGDGLFYIAKNHQQSLCIAMIDVDNFAFINEKLGRDKGDLVIQKISSSLNHLKRQGDCIGRWRGQNWLLILPHSSATDSVQIFARIQQALYDEPAFQNDALAITVSMGIAEMTQWDDTFESLLQKADTALIQAKTAGKNQVKLYQQKTS